MSVFYESQVILKNKDICEKMLYVSACSEIL